MTPINHTDYSGNGTNAAQMTAAAAPSIFTSDAMIKDSEVLKTFEV